MSAEETFREAGWAGDGFSKPQGQLVVTFKTVQKKDEFQTTAQGRPVFKEVVHIMKYPADQYLKIDRPVTKVDKEEFPREWERWEKTRETAVLGLPIENWHSITDTQKAEFRAINIFTVEQFANLPDSYGQKIMGFNELRAKARVFVESGKDAELVSKIRAEANEQVDALRKQVEEMKAMMEQMTRPAKAKVTA